MLKSYGKTVAMALLIACASTASAEAAKGRFCRTVKVDRECWGDLCKTKQVCGSIYSSPAAAQKQVIRPR